MLGLGAILFFSVTGITVNHPDWFYQGAQQAAETKGRLEAKWLKVEPPPGGAPFEPASPESVSKLEVVEFLRGRHHVGGALADFSVNENECVVSFKGPGYAADAFIDRTTGNYTLTETRFGLVAVLNDLHKGRDTGAAWSVIIDCSAGIMVIAAVTGLVLPFIIKRRRAASIAAIIAGVIAIIVIFALCVP
jgi:hypothetical protein